MAVHANRPTDDHSARRIDELEAELVQARQTLGALRSGEVDSLVVQTPQGEKLFVADGADHVYRTLVETMPEGAVSLAPGGTIVYANLSLGTMLRTPLMHLFGAQFDGFVDAGSAAAFAALCRRAAAGTASGDVELRRPDGTRFPARIALTTLPPGSPAALSLVVSDLTERARREREERTLDRLVLAVSTAADVDSALQSLLSHAREHLGWRDGQTWRPHDLPGAAPAADADFVAAGGRPNAAVAALVADARRSQREAWSRTAVAIPVMALDRVACVLVFGLDGPPTAADRDGARLMSVAGRQLGSLMLRAESERRLGEVARFFDVANDLIATVGFDGRLQRLNDRWRQLLGWTSDELRSGPLTAFVHAEDVEPTARQMARAVGSVTPTTFTSRFAIKAGGWRWLEWTTTCAIEEKLIYASARDVTDRVAAEEAMRQAQADAAEARDEAIEASRMKSAFLANMSHEIRTPLNGVLGMAELLLDSPLDAEQRENARLLKGSGETLTAVVDDILDFSKIEAGALRLECIDFDLIEAIEDACDLIAERVHTKDVELTMDLAAELPTIVRGDPVRIRQVIANLLSNAVKFTRAGEVRVGLAIADRGDAQTWIRFEVADTGIGIEPARLAQVFEPFVQADDSTTRQYGGTGLGLAIVKQLVELMEGEIGADSTPGVGSRFWFVLPLEPGEPEALSLHPGPALVGTRLLAVDDNATNRRLIEQLAQRWQMPVAAAASGREALVLLRDAATRGEPFQCAAIDMNMPDMTGIELAEEMHRDSRFPTPAMVMLTSSFGQRRQAREAGIDIYMTKPVRRIRLQSALAEALGVHSQRQKAPERFSAQAGSSPVILIAEDNDVNQALAVQMVRRRGYQAEVVGDGHAALEALAQRSFAAVLMDCQMPELNGYDATAELRRREGDSAHMPVIALTANALRSDRAKCLDSGMDDYISKPVKAAELDRVLARWAPRTTDAPSPTGEAASPARTVVAGRVDRAALDRLRADLGSDDVLRQIVDIFGARTPMDLAMIRQAIADSDSEIVRGIAHQLQGSCATLAAVDLAELCRQLDEIAAGSLDAASALVDRIEPAFIQSYAALRAQLP